MFFKEFYQKNPVAGTYSCSLVSMLICLLGRVLHWIHCGEFWRGKMGCCCSGKLWFKSLRMGKNVKNGNWGWNSFNGIDFPPSGPSLYLKVDLAFIQGCSVILCLKADTLHKNYHVFCHHLLTIKSWWSKPCDCLR